MHPRLYLSPALNGIAVIGLIGLLAIPPHQERPATEQHPHAQPTSAPAYPRPPIAETITGPAAYISDGDTLYVATEPGACGPSGRSPRRGAHPGCRAVRLQGLDAPESNQPCTLPDGQTTWCGISAKAALVDLIGSHELVCETPADDPTDRYGRALAFCRAGSTDLSLEMLRAGQAVAYRQFLKSRPHAATFVAAEREAYEARRGIWATQFVAPSDWRKAQRNGT